MLDIYRQQAAEEQFCGGPNERPDITGIFLVPSPTGGGTLRVIASVGEGWDHVSVSLPNRCPNWPEMDAIHRLFFRADETAMQLHVPVSDHVNNHPYTLHLFRPLNAEIPRPPSILVGLKDKTPEEVRAMTPEEIDAEVEKAMKELNV